MIDNHPAMRILSTCLSQIEVIKMMKVKYIWPTEFLVLTKGKIYDVISIEKGWYRIVDDSGEDYLYPPSLFEIV